MQSIATQSKGLQKMQDNAKLFCPTVAMQLEYIAMQGFAMPCNGRYELQCFASLIPDRICVCVPICEVGEVLLNYKPSYCLFKVCIFKARYSLSYILIHFNFFNCRFGVASWSSSKSVLQNHKLLNDSNWWSFLHQTLYSNENNIYLYFVQPSFI